MKAGPPPVALLHACQASSIPMTVVLPLPVAILSAVRTIPGLASAAASLSARAIQVAPSFVAASTRKIAVSTAST